MKIRRFLSVFFVTCLLCTLLTPQALALEGIPAGLPRLPLTPLSGSHLPVLEQMLSAMPEP